MGRYERLSPLVEKDLAKLLELEIDLHLAVERVKADLKSRYDFSSSAAFSCLDSLRENNINNRNLASFMKFCGYYATDAEISAIVRRLDVDGD